MRTNGFIVHRSMYGQRGYSTVVNRMLRELKIRGLGFDSGHDVGFLYTLLFLLALILLNCLSVLNQVP